MHECACIPLVSVRPDWIKISYALDPKTNLKKTNKTDLAILDNIRNVSNVHNLFNQKILAMFFNFSQIIWSRCHVSTLFGKKMFLHICVTCLTRSKVQNQAPERGSFLVHSSTVLHTRAF
jgi:NADPH-dependent 7-cyano-7-deazaguanine reductase QueF